MKSFFLFILIITNTSFFSVAQSFEDEIDKLSQMLVNNLNNKKKVKKVAVADFTFKGQPNTRIGKYLADELSTGLSMNGARFTMVNREKVRKEMTIKKKQPKKKTDIDGLAKKGLDVGTDGENETKEEKNEDMVELGVKGFKEIFKNKKLLRGTSIIIYGTIEDKGDYLRVILEATKNNKSADVIGGARGNITKTPEIRELLQGTVSTPPIPESLPSSETGYPTDFSDSSSPTFKHGNLLFEVVGCQQNGKEIECKVNIIAKENDVNLYIYKNNNNYWFTRIIDANGGHEFHVTEMRLADNVTTGNRAGKTLIADFSIEGILRFTNVNREVSSISRLEIATKGFLVSLGPISVQ